MLAEHNLGSKLDKIDLQHLGDEREASGSPQVTLDNLNLVLLVQELDIERTGNLKRTCNLAGNLLDSADSVTIP